MENNQTQKSDEPENSNSGMIVAALIIAVVVIIGLYITLKKVATNTSESNNNTEVECTSSWSEETTEACTYSLDYESTTNYINFHKKDKYGVWFEKEKYSRMRIVYNFEKSTLLVYLNETLFKRYEGIKAVSIVRHSNDCVDGKRVMNIMNGTELVGIRIQKNENIIVYINYPHRNSYVFYYLDNNNFYSFNSKRNIPY